MESQGRGQKISVYSYDDYRKFLKDLYVQAKAESAKFSFRYFARIAGFKSPNFFKRVIDGDRNLTEDSIEKLARALKLNKEESVFFRHLVLLNQAKTVDERQANAEKLLKSQIFRKIYPLKESQFNYYTHWYYVPIRELAGLPGFVEDPAWIAQQLNPNITPAEAQEALGELIKLGLLVRDSNGKLVQAQADLSTGDQLTSASLAQFHRVMSRMAGESIDRVARENRQISSVTLGISESTFKKIKEMVNQFQVELVETASREASPEVVYQLNFQIFPLTKKMEEEPS